jgi:hypothetical protein
MQTSLKNVYRMTSPSPLALATELAASSPLINKDKLGSRMSEHSDGHQQLTREETDVSDPEELSTIVFEVLSSEESLCSSTPSLIDDIGDTNETPLQKRCGSSKRKLRSGEDEKLFDMFHIPTSSASALSSQDCVSLASGSPYFDKVPRLERTLGHANETWQSIDESEDELSFLSVSLSQDNSTAHGVLLTGIRSRQVKRRRKSKRQKSMSGGALWSDMDSVDELCI